MDAFERICQTLQKQTDKTLKGNQNVSVEFGEITSDFSLKVSRFDTPIPKGEYFLDKRLSIDYKPEIEVKTESASSHSHTIKIPLTEGISRIVEGDMVLVCWVGIDPVVLAVIVSGKVIG